MAESGDFWEKCVNFGPPLPSTSSGDGWFRIRQAQEMATLALDIERNYFLLFWLNEW
jgi:hypothetical protein